MKYLLTICILFISGCSQPQQLSGDLKVIDEKVEVVNEKVVDMSGKVMDMSKVKLQDIAIDEDEFFHREFKDLFINIDLYNQLSKQGIKMNIKGDVASGLDKEVKRVMKGKTVKIIDKNGTINTKLF
jgi:hypothetical protein